MIDGGKDKMKSFVKTIKELWKDPMGRIGIVGVVLLILMAIFAPLLAPYEYDAIGRRFQAPTAEHIFGTDKFGRDIFSRVLYGARVSMEVGLIAVGIGAFFGYLLGLTAGYFEGKVDRVIMCIMDILFAFPSILLAIFFRRAGQGHRTDHGRIAAVTSGLCLARCAPRSLRQGAI